MNENGMKNFMTAVGAGALIVVLALGFRACGWTADEPTDTRTPAPRTSTAAVVDLADAYTRCLLAMDAAEIPPSIGLCVEPRITEDDHRWSCRTMGDGVCGPDRVTYGNGRYVA